MKDKMTVKDTVTVQLYKDSKYTAPDGKVAAIYHPNYGPGWYTHHLNKSLLFDPYLVDLILKKNSNQLDPVVFYNQVQQYYHNRHPPGNDRVPNPHRLSIYWLTPKAEFIVMAQDGWEEIWLKNSLPWIQA